MTNRLEIAPDFIFESSWEVCNKVGGIYTVLSTKARTLQNLYRDHIVFIGPDVWGDKIIADFKEDNLFTDWQKATEGKRPPVKIGRWQVPGFPPAILVDFKSLMVERDKFFYEMWDTFKVDSIHAYGDYDASCIFAYATGKVIESFYHYYKMEKKKVVALFNEWMLGMGELYIKKYVPAIATIFTTHATSIGRSIAGNGKALYAYLDGFNGDQMAKELNMEAKHSVEKTAAREADCFTTVSDITARECKQLLGKEPDVVTPNGFEPDFVPTGVDYKKRRLEARHTLINIANKLLGCHISENAMLVSTSGRYEYQNKGIDVFIEAMHRLRSNEALKSEVVAFIMVPAWVKEPRADLKEMIAHDLSYDKPLQKPFLTHWLNNMQEDRVLNYINYCGFTNNASEKLKIIFIPSYLNGSDGIFNKIYYDLLIGMDVTVYPSYYEPWGYTPLESIAFGIPTITTDLAGFGKWADKTISGTDITEGVAVVNRTDFNYFDVADAITKHILTLMNKGDKEKAAIRNNCFKLASLAQWNHFIVFYQKAFVEALSSSAKRNKQKCVI
jgi:glycosyltransferase involved in cell wall biosynthesis